jgi:alpha-mannosidase
MSLWSAPGLTKPSFDEAKSRLLQDEEGKPFHKDDWLGPSWTNHWLRVKINIPASWKDVDEEVVFEFDPSCEALIFTPEGDPIHGQ